MWEADSRLACRWEYSTDLLEAATIERMAGHMEVLLANLLAEPARSIWQVELLPATERDQILRAWNATASAYRDDLCVHQAFEQRAAEQEHAPAVMAGSDELSYGELNRRANRLAHHLRRLGVAPEARVGLCLERSAALIVGVLAVLKAGGAYVPLDPAYPAERLAYMVRDSGVCAVVSEAAHAGKLPQDVPVVCLDREWPRIAQEPAENPAAGVTPQNLAYVIYTSGSTGRPKGVMIEHAGLTQPRRLALGDLRRHALGRATQLESLSFDASVWQIRPLPGSRCGPPYPGRRYPSLSGRAPSLAGPPAYHVWFMPTPLAEAGLQEPCPPGLALRALLTGGDRLQAQAGSPACPLIYQSLWADRVQCSNTWVPVSPGWRRVQPAADRPADRQCGSLRAGSPWPARAGGCAGRAVYRRSGPRPRLPQPARPDRRALRPAFVRPPGRRPALPHRRPRPLPPRREPGVPGKG